MPAVASSGDAALAHFPKSARGGWVDDGGHIGVCDGFRSLWGKKSNALVKSRSYHAAQAQRRHSCEPPCLFQAVCFFAFHVRRQPGHVFCVSQRGACRCARRGPCDHSHLPSRAPPLTHPPTRSAAPLPHPAARFVSAPANYDTVGLIACVLVVNACIAGYVWMAFNEAEEEEQGGGGGGAVKRD